jgi:ABC-2 type transport system permease protein
MTLWRLELLRLLRTRRWIALAAVYLLLGLGEPLATYYLGQLLQGSTGGDTYIHVTVTTPHASDAMTAYFSNVTTLGTLVSVVVAGLAFSVRANPPLAAIYLTHVPNRIALLLPRLVTVAIAVAISAAIGGGAAAYETAAVIGAPAAAATATGVLLSVLGALFAVAVTFLAACLLRSQVGAIAVALVVVFVAVPFADLIPGVRHVGPNAFTRLPAVLQTVAWRTDDTWSTVVTVALALGCVAGGLWQARRWEL